MNLAEACSAVGAPEMHCDDEKTASPDELVAEGLVLAGGCRGRSRAAPYSRWAPPAPPAVLDGDEWRTTRGR